MEQWLQERSAYTEELQRRIRQSGVASEIAAWERFVRQTARMEATADQLGRSLPPVFGLSHGLRLQYQGVEVYFEHLVVGPTGLFLIETMEGDDPGWLAGLERSAALVRQVLGAQSGFFLPLVINRTGILVEFPVGTQVVDSLEAAVAVIQSQRFGTEFSPALAREFWTFMDRLRVRGAMRPLGEGFFQRIGRLEWSIVATTIAMALVLTVKDGEGLAAWVAGLVMVVFPVCTVLGLIQLMPRAAARKTAAWILLSLTVLWFLLLFSVVD